MTIRQWGIIWGVIFAILALSFTGYGLLNAKADKQEVRESEIRLNARITETQASLKDQVAANTTKLNKIYDITLSIAAKVGVNQSLINKGSGKYDKKGW